MVENECIKWIKERSGFTKRNRPSSSHDERRYAFYGSDVRISLDEASSIINASLRRKNIQPGKASAIARRILKKMKVRKVWNRPL
jgi:capsule polysaccharide export protein KpsE/RkpR